MEVEPHQSLTDFDLCSMESFPYTLGAPMDTAAQHSPAIPISAPYGPPAMEFPETAAPPADGGQKFLDGGEVNGGAPLSPATGESTKVTGKSTAAVKLQKTYRSYRTRRRLADSAVVAEEFWWQAIDFIRLKRSTISFFHFHSHESAASRWNRVSLNASKVGQGLSKDAKAQKLAFQHWIEAIDPRHRYGHTLHLYYEQWCQADSGQPFFYWLDVGDGKEVELKECPRPKLRQQCIKYLGPKEREQYEYVIVDGKVIHKLTGVPLDTNWGSKKVKWIFVMSTSKNLYAGEKKKGRFHHSSFLAGGATLAAGRLVAEQGILKSVSPYSGHYRPTDDVLDSFLEFLKENGVNLDAVQINTANEDYDSYEGGKLAGEIPTNSEAPVDECGKELPSSESAEVAKGVERRQTQTKSSYERTLSGGLQSPRAEVPKKAILQRINSKNAASSYQLGHQLSLKWSTGAGPRIGCVADYPKELRTQALEFVSLSPRPQTSPGFTRVNFPASPAAPHPAVESCIGNVAPGV